MTVARGSSSPAAASPSARRGAGRIVVWYVVVASLWIFLSDTLLSLFTSDPKLLTRIAIYKGWAYVLITAAMLYGLIYRWAVRWEGEHRRTLRAEQQYHQIVTTANEGICALDSERRILFVNPRLGEMLGYRPEELIGRKLDAFIPPEEQADLARRHQAHTQGGVETFEGQFLHRSGARRWALVSAAPLLDAEGGRCGSFGMITDISDRVRAEEQRRSLERQLQQTQKLESLGVLAGGIAHDFNNLLTVILGHAHLVRTEMPADSPWSDGLAEVERAARHAADLCRQMLAYAGRGQVAIQPLPLVSLVDEVTGLMKGSLPKKILWQCEYAEGLPPIEADPTQIRQVVMNLLTNAAEAIGEREGTIRLTVGALDCSEAYLRESPYGEAPTPGRFVFLEVADTGVGMDEATRTRVFDPFFTTKFTGRGLGLAAVLGIVRGHKGSIRVDSNPGVGSTFRVLFPASSRVPASPPPPAAAIEDAGQGTVLIVEDEPPVLALACRLVEHCGYRVLTASDGLEALQVFDTHSAEIDCVLLDLTMPRLDGVETFRELQRRCPGLRVVLVSGYSEQEVAQRFAGQPLAGHLAKPYDIHALRTVLNAALSSPPGPR